MHHHASYFMILVVGWLTSPKSTSLSPHTCWIRLGIITLCNDPVILLLLSMEVVVVPTAKEEQGLLGPSRQQPCRKCLQDAYTPHDARLGEILQTWSRCPILSFLKTMAEFRRAVSSFLVCIFFMQKRQRIYAVSEVCWCRAVIKHVSQM